MNLMFIEVSDLGLYHAVRRKCTECEKRLIVCISFPAGVFEPVPLSWALRISRSA